MIQNQPKQTNSTLRTNYLICQSVQNQPLIHIAEFSCPVHAIM